MQKQKILLAEDDLTMISLLKTLLKMEGFEVVTLHADADVLDVIRTERPDVLLLDVHLGNQNGLDILKSIRSTQDLEKTKVVMSSGANVREECMSQGAFGFLMKPYMPDDLITLLKRAIKSV